MSHLFAYSFLSEFYVETHFKQFSFFFLNELMLMFEKWKFSITIVEKLFQSTPASPIIPGAPYCMVRVKYTKINAEYLLNIYGASIIFERVLCYTIQNFSHPRVVLLNALLRIMFQFEQLQLYSATLLPVYSNALSINKTLTTREKI